MIIYLPNLLTLARLALVPWLVVLMQQQDYLMSLVIFALAGISDGLDGYIAKKYNAKTELGAILDPLADKALLVSSYVMLALLELIPFWLVVTVVFRDVVIISGYLIMTLFFESVAMQPLRISKLNTVLQIGFILVLLTSLAWQIDLSGIIAMLAYLVFVSSVVSGVAYVSIWAIKATKGEL